MIFSYYFDTERTHLLVCGFDVSILTEKEDGTIETTFTAYIEERNAGVIVKREQRTSSFTFAPSTDETAKHDIDFIRTRYAPEKKWIFNVKNNKLSSQDVMIGLISDTANKNPLGMDVFFNEEEYNAELRANNLAQLDQYYVAPDVQQTLVNANFATTGFPTGFTSTTGIYNGTFQLVEAKEFNLAFREPIPATAKFMIEASLAPESVQPATGTEIFHLQVVGLGDVHLMTDGLKFRGVNALEDTITYFNAPISAEQFFNSGFQAAAKLKITGDGLGGLTLEYAGVTITGTYNQNNTMDSLAFTGLPVYTEIVNPDPTVPPELIESKIDNLKITYVI